MKVLLLYLSHPAFLTSYPLDLMYSLNVNCVAQSLRLLVAFELGF